MLKDVSYLDIGIGPEVGFVGNPDDAVQGSDIGDLEDVFSSRKLRKKAAVRAAKVQHRKVALTLAVNLVGEPCGEAAHAGLDLLVASTYVLGKSCIRRLVVNALLVVAGRTVIG